MVIISTFKHQILLPSFASEVERNWVIFLRGGHRRKTFVGAGVITPVIIISIIILIILLSLLLYFGYAIVIVIIMVVAVIP